MKRWGFRRKAFLFLAGMFTYTINVWAILGEIESGSRVKRYL